MQIHLSSFHVRLTLELLLLLVLLPAIFASSSSFVSTSGNYQNFSLPSYCRDKCGNISVPYPFGIDRGCFRPGFNLTCVYQYRRDAPAQLYLGDGVFEVTEIDVQNSRVSAKLPVYTMGLGVDSMTFPLYDALPSSWPYAIYTSSSVFVYGCSVKASIVDLANNSAVIDSCYTLCLEFDSSESGAASDLSVTNCRIDIFQNKIPLPSFVVQLTRIKRTDKLSLGKSTSIKAFLSGDFGPTDDLIRGVVTSNMAHVEVLFSWYMGDYTSCDMARKDHNKTYACLAEFSQCSELYSNRTVGYWCFCNNNYDGNPYQPDGCKEIDIPILSPPANCSRKCGTVDIPFPFGLDSGCYRLNSFALKCNTTNNPPDLSFSGGFNVSKILVEEGKILANSTMPFDFDYSPFTSLEGEYFVSWVIEKKTCEAAAKKRSTFACVDANSVCLETNSSKDAAGYRCKCDDGYQGNPYLEGGCKDIDECKLPDKCYGLCRNTNGSFICTCQPGTIGDPFHGQCIPNKKKSLVLGIIIGASTGIGILLLSIVVVISIRTWKTRKQIKAKEKHFRQNHGLLLQQLISSSESTAERTRIFSLEEIEKATNNFDETRVVGRGGHGTVYKGILSDQRVAAIKRSKHIKQSEIDEFINEVTILSQINHRNVVKLFGCCLETQVPLLIYEFISNGTLSDHLHVPNGKSTLSWDDRLRIAAEAAGSLAYLHSAASISIFHRDVKSSNILLDDHFVAKVSDFGASRFIPLDQTHVVTAIQGTFGYLDPEYYQTSQLTGKSDVYSFGVILLELLTEKKPIYLTEGDAQVNLSMQFLQAVRQHRSFDLVEDRIMEEAAEEELVEIIHLIETCLRLKGVERPTMKEVECKLQELRMIRMKRRYCIGEGNAGDQYLPTTSCYYSPCESVDQTSQGATRNYSLEKELMWSQHCPR